MMSYMACDHVSRVTIWETAIALFITESKSFSVDDCGK